MFVFVSRLFLNRGQHVQQDTEGIKATSDYEEQQLPSSHLYALTLTLEAHE
jgi:hypothetical protein